MYSKVTTVNNTVVYTCNLPRRYIISVLTTKIKMVTMWDDRYVIYFDCGDYLLHYVYLCQNIKLYT